MMLKSFIKSGIQLPVDIETVYYGLIKKSQKLKCGWLAVFLKNDMVILVNNDIKRFPLGGIKKIIEADDNKFMIIRKNGEKAIWNQYAQRITDFSKDTELFFNGWYCYPQSDGLALFDNTGYCVGRRLKAAYVFQNGYYSMSVLNVEDAAYAGVYNASRKRILFTNSPVKKMFKNRTFYVDGDFYDRDGNPLDLHIKNKYLLYVIDKFVF